MDTYISNVNFRAFKVELCLGGKGVIYISGASQTTITSNINLWSFNHPSWKIYGASGMYLGIESSVQGV
jgi:hypothetical protein